MKMHEARRELRRMNRGDLFGLALSHRISGCQIGGRSCGFYLCYEGFGFCISEILGQSCQVERTEALEGPSEGLREMNDYPSA